MEIYTDFAVSAGEGRDFTILQLTDMQVIDSAQQRFPTRLCEAERIKWETERVEECCYDRIRRLTETVRPDLIVITGDVVYGEFDDAGTSQRAFCEFMGSLGTPWAPVFGNHDLESAVGVDAICQTYEGAKNCLFRRGDTDGNSNYTVGICRGERLLRVLYMMDSNACYDGTDPALVKVTGFTENQKVWLTEEAARIREACGDVPGFVCCHIVSADAREAIVAAGYQTEETIGEAGGYSVGTTAPGSTQVLLPHSQGDCGYKNEVLPANSAPMADVYREAGVDGVFTGHYHKINLSVAKDGIRYTFGVKTGSYDYHTPGQLGGTVVMLAEEGRDFTVVPLYMG